MSTEQSAVTQPAVLPRVRCLGCHGAGLQAARAALCYRRDHWYLRRVLGDAPLDFAVLLEARGSP